MVILTLYNPNLKGMNMRISKTLSTLTLALSFLTSNVTLATTNITLSCKVVTEGERTSELSTQTVTFDTEKRYKDLSFKVYNAEVAVSTSFYMTADGKKCGHKVNQICVKQAESVFCTTNPEATMYPTGEFAQSGDRTSIICKINGAVVGSCPEEK